MRRQVIARLLYMDELYRRIQTVPGIIMECGVRWGQNMSFFISLRGIYEPFNQGRLIVGLDTFEGFVSIHEKDGSAAIAQNGAFGVTEDYEKHLKDILAYHESEAPMNHIKKYELVKGDACKTISEYLKNRPETIIALAYLDFDIYAPTHACLKALRPYLTKGSVLAFDELHMREFPGETIALQEVLGLSNCRLVRSPYAAGHQAYMVIE